MRKSLLLLCVSTLAACGGGGPQTVSGTAPPGTGTGGGTSTHTFVTPTEKKTYSAIGGVQRYSYSTDENAGYQYDQNYAGNASTARNSNISISYDPRDAVFELVVSDTAAGVDNNTRFQDPAHRTDYGGAVEPQDGNIDITNRTVRYLQADTGSSGLISYDQAQSGTFPVGAEDGAVRNVSTFFYQRPGTTTNYVTYAGFVRNQTTIVEVELPDSSKYLRQDHVLERAAFVFGERTDNNAVPRTGTAAYTGDMLATMVFNPLIDNGQSDTYFQWIAGTNTTNIDFGAGTFNSSFTGTVDAPQFDVYTSRDHVLDAGATFTAAASGAIDLVGRGGFVGQVNSASFVQNGTTHTVDIAGSSVDGAFFGPAAQEIGGGFRIVGGTPDERIDIMGAYTAKRP